MTFRQICAVFENKLVAYRFRSIWVRNNDEKKNSDFHLQLAVILTNMKIILSKNFHNFYYCYINSSKVRKRKIEREFANLDGYCLK